MNIQNKCDEILTLSYAQRIIHLEELRKEIDSITYLPESDVSLLRAYYRYIRELAREMEPVLLLVA